MKPYLIHHLLEASADRMPDKTAVSEPDRSVTYGGLLENSRKFASGLAEAGLRKGGHVGILLDKSIDQVHALFGTWIAGGVAVVINQIGRAHV